MTVTRAGTWNDAQKGLRVQAKDGSVWTLERMTFEDGVISVTMASEVDPGRTVVVNPASYGDPITIVETLPFAAGVAMDEAAVRTRGQLLAAETLQRHRDELKAKLADADRIAAEALARAANHPPSASAAQAAVNYADSLRTADSVPYVAPMPEIQPETALAPATAEAAPLQTPGDVWPSPPADDWTEGEMLAHLFLFHGDWATGQTTAKSGKKLLVELHERHQAATEAGHTAGLAHFHRSKES
jgi:hypothetical protein